MMSGEFGPAPSEIISHEVEKIQVLSSASEIDVSQAVFAHRKSRCNKISRRWQRCPSFLKQFKEVDSLGRCRWMLPVDCYSSYQQLTRHEERITLTINAVELVLIAEFSHLTGEGRP